MPKFDDSFVPSVEEYAPGDLKLVVWGKEGFKQIGNLKSAKSVKSIMSSLIKENCRYTLKCEGLELKAHILDDKEKTSELIASVDAVKKFLPKNIDFEKNYDLVAISSEGYEANSQNLNGHMVEGHTAIALAKTFVNKFWDFSHERSTVVGVITNYNFIDSQTKDELTEEQAAEYADKNKVFRVVVSGLMWRVVNPELADALEEAAVENPGALSSSYEVGFNSYVIAAGGSTIDQCEIISSEDQISELKSMLKPFGGEGKDSRGRKLSLLLNSSEDCLGLGFGIVTNPASGIRSMAVKSANTINLDQSVNEDITESAMTKELEKEKIAAAVVPPINQPEGIEPAKLSVTQEGKLTLYIQEYNTTSDRYCQLLLPHILAGDDFETATTKVNNYLSKVAGVVTETSQYVAPLEQDEDIKFPDAKAQIVEGEENKNSQTVISNTTNFKIMKLTKIDELNTEMLKEISASEIKEVVAAETAQTLAEAAKEYVDSIKAEKERAEKAEAELKAATDKLEEFTARLAKIESDAAEVKAESDFQNRMSFLSDEFELSDEARASILDDVKGCSDDEGFKKFVAKLSVFATKKKKFVKDDKMEDKKDKGVDKKDEVDASVILAGLEADAPKLPNKETSSETNVDLFARVFENAITFESKK